MNGRALDTQEIIETVKTLTRRVEERFPASNLSGFSTELEALAREADETTAAIRRPNVLVRLAVAVTVAGLVGVTPGQVTFTGSGTEALNQALCTVAARTPPTAKIVASSVEHPAALRQLEKYEIAVQCDAVVEALAD